MLLPRVYLITELTYIEKLLEKMPLVTVGTHVIMGQSNSVYRIKLVDQETDRTYWKEVSADKASEQIKNMALRRQALEGKYKQLKLMWNENFRDDFHKYAGQYKLVKINTKFDGKFFEEAESQALEVNENVENFHNGYRMRSRTEVLIAKDLEAMGLEYKYEVAVPGTTKCADFLVYLRSLDCCFFLEFLGKIRELDYLIDNAGKFSQYGKADMRINYEVAALIGDKMNYPSRNEVEFTINHVIQNLCEERLQKTA